ncbi:hypothetical protein ACQE98_13345 [Ornithinimicrobium sp. W1679]
MSGPRRREDVARFLTRAGHGVRVTGGPHGWTVTGQTGATTVRPTLEGVVTAVAGSVPAGSWAEVEQLLEMHEGRAQGYDDPYPDAVPRLPRAPAGAPAVLRCGPGGRLHLRLTAFLLGLRVIPDAGVVTLAVTSRHARFTLVGGGGTGLTVVDAG